MFFILTNCQKYIWTTFQHFILSSFSGKYWFYHYQYQSHCRDVLKIYWKWIRQSLRSWIQLCRSFTKNWGSTGSAQLSGGQTTWKLRLIAFPTIYTMEGWLTGSKWVRTTIFWKKWSSNSFFERHELESTYYGGVCDP